MIIFYIFVDWVWLNGEDVGNQHSHLPATRDETDENAKSYPGSRSGAGWWTDHLNGQVWMFGGRGYDGHLTEQAMVLTDLWMFSSKGNSWRCVNRGEITKLTHSIPPKRHLAAMCGVHSIAIIVFGGEGSGNHILSDTWVYNVNKAAWLPLAFKGNVPTPTARKGCAHWCVHDKMIVYGGVDEHNNTLSDMWQFSLKTLIWQRITPKGETKPTDGTVLSPRARYGASTWRGKHWTLYMFGGISSKLGYFSDLWVFSLHNLTWKLIHDSQQMNRPVRYGTLGIGAKENCPGGRSQSASWFDLHGNLWILGGETTLGSSLPFLPDLWQYNMQKNMWIWMQGPNTDISKLKSHPGTTANHFKSSMHMPSSRSSSGTWTYRGVMYLFGGFGQDARNKTVFMNDLWILTQGNVTYMFSEENPSNWFKKLPASTIFIVVLCTIGGIALTFGAVFYIKKMIEYPHHQPGSGFKVRYSPLVQEATLEAET